MAGALLPPRTRAAAALTRTVNAVSRRMGVGSGTVVGGRAGLAVDRRLLSRLASGRPVALVTGTNGKTTTTRLLSVAVADLGPVVTNATGSNMPEGHVAALVAGPPGATAVLEADEGYVPGLVADLTPRVVVLLNLSRDQLDRTSEVRILAGRWREALGRVPATTVVANADDPLVAWGAGTAERVIWVGAGLGWRLDAVGCPACEGRIDFAPDGWSCACGFARPPLDVWVGREGGGAEARFAEARFADGRRVPVALAIPGRFNQANATLAAAAAEVLGVPAGRALGRMAAVEEVAGRFAVRAVAGVPTRVMLAKNPAGWSELLDLVCPGAGPVVVGINARVADGRDPSWLWDVPFERLRGRPVVATGERCRDLAVCLRYAEVAHTTLPDPVAAVRSVAGRPDPADAGTILAGASPEVDFIGNYTAFHDLLGRR
ncbi:MAG: DUF1727 domain-containing protein [Acidimicrobiales bacterium]